MSKHSQKRPLPSIVVLREDLIDGFSAPVAKELMFLNPSNSRQLDSKTPKLSKAS